MASGIYVTIKLDSFYQKFLRGYFGQQDEVVFAFPKRSRYKFNELLHWLVDYPPLTYKPRDYGKDNFRVELPRAQHFSIECRNYLSERSEEMFRRQVRNFYLNILYSCIDESVLKFNMSRTDAIDRFMQMYNLVCFDDERIKKTIQRYRKRIWADFYNKDAKVKKTRKKIYS
jgi:hypothetical protein